MDGRNPPDRRRQLAARTRFAIEARVREHRDGLAVAADRFDPLPRPLRDGVRRRDGDAAGIEAAEDRVDEVEPGRKIEKHGRASEVTLGERRGYAPRALVQSGIRALVDGSAAPVEENESEVVGPARGLSLENRGKILCFLHFNVPSTTSRVAYVRGGGKMGYPHRC